MALNPLSARMFPAWVESTHLESAIIPIKESFDSNRVLLRTRVFVKLGSTPQQHSPLFPSEVEGWRARAHYHKALGGNAGMIYLV